MKGGICAHRSEYLKKIEQEEIIQKITMVDNLEKLSPYPNPLAQGDFWSRISRACEYVPEEYHFYAQALFANVVYIPSLVLDEAWRYCLREVCRLSKINKDNFLSQVVLFGEDSDLVRRFCYANNLWGRLDLDKQPRSPRVGDFVKDVLLSWLLHRDPILSELYEHLNKEITCFIKRRYWLLLVDNALSGISLKTELEKILNLAQLVNPDVEIYVMVQIITSDALKTVKETIRNSEKSIKIIEAIYLDESYKINSDNCKLFASQETLKGVRELCKWFADEILNKDERYNSAKRLSGDNLEFGFRASGLTLVTPNCPSNSIPLLWYYRRSVYEGPYPRVESRVSQVRSLDNEILESLLKIKNPNRNLMIRGN